MRGRFRTALRLAIGVLFVAAAAGVAAAMHAFKRFVRDSPRFCESCHEVSPEVAVWVESEHRQVRCQSCHHNTLDEGLHTLKVYLTGGNITASHAVVDIKTCADCHAGHDPRWPSIANSRGHLVHANKEGIACTKCHGQQMHFDTPARETCAPCHEKQTLRGGHSSDHCLACHNFLTTDDVIKPQRSDCLRCHLNSPRPIVVDTAAPMQLRCSACHRPHGDPAVVPCDACHKEHEIIGLHDTKAHERCDACHAAHTWTTRPDQCFACHTGMQAHHPEETCTHCHAFKKGLRRQP